VRWPKSSPTRTSPSPSPAVTGEWGCSCRGR
jgi:hypothetical protein